MKQPTSILAFRNGSIGNTLVAVPALRALRKRYPTARISVVVDPLGYELLEQFSWIDQLIVYDKHNQHRSLSAQLRLIRELRRQKPSHAVLFKRFFRNGLLSYLSGADVRVGFRTDGRAPFLTHTVDYSETINVVDLNFRLAALLDAPIADRSLELPLSAADRHMADEFLRPKVQSCAQYVTAYYGGKTVAPDFISLAAFAGLVRTIVRNEFPVVLVGAGQDETALAEEIAESLPLSIVATDLRLRVSAALIEKSALFIGLSSGPSHIAAAVKTPALVVLRPDAPTYSEETKWLPVGENIIPLTVPPHASADTWHLTSSSAIEQARESMALRMKAAAI